MNPRHHKRFTYPEPLPGKDAKSLLDDLLAKLPKLDEDKPFEKELSGLLRESLSWLNLFKDPRLASRFDAATPRSSQSPRCSDEALSSEEIASLMEAGKFAKAKRAARHVLRGANVKEAIAQEASSPQASGPVTSALQVIAVIAHMQGDSEQAAKAYRLLVRLYSTHAGQDAEATLQYKYSLAELYAEDAADKAIDLLDQVIASCERVGATSSTIYAAAKSLGGALRVYDEDSELLEEASAYLTDAVAVQARLYESDPEVWPQLVTTITRLAQLANFRDESKVATGHYERAIELYRKHIDQENSQAILRFATVLMEYGQELLGNGENSNAIRAGRESVRLIRQRFGPLSVESIPFLLDLGHLCRDTQEPEWLERACRVFKKVVVLHEQHFRHPEDYLAEAGSLLDAYKGLIATYASLGSYKKAESAARRALRVIVDLEANPVETHQIYKMLAFICESDGRSDEAQQYEEMAKEVMDASDSLDGEDDEEDEDPDDPGNADGEDEDDDDDEWWRGSPQNDENDE